LYLKSVSIIIFVGNSRIKFDYGVDDIRCMMVIMVDCVVCGLMKWESFKDI